MHENQGTEHKRRIAYMPESDEKEALLRAIDVLSMEVLRLKSENEVLKSTVDSFQRGKRGQINRGYQPESLRTKVINYYKREGLRNTLKKVFWKVQGK